MNNPHRYEDASNTWSEIDWTKIPDGPTFSNTVEVSATKMQRLYRSSDRYDYAMACIGRCNRLTYAPACDCDETCRLVEMHLKWKDSDGRG